MYVNAISFCINKVRFFNRIYLWNNVSNSTDKKTNLIIISILTLEYQSYIPIMDNFDFLSFNRLILLIKINRHCK